MEAQDLASSPETSNCEPEESLWQVNNSTRKFLASSSSARVLLDSLCAPVNSASHSVAESSLVSPSPTAPIGLGPAVWVKEAILETWLRKVLRWLRREGEGEGKCW